MLLSAIFPSKLRLVLSDPFSNDSSFCVVCVCKYCHWKNQNRRSKMGLTSHLSDDYNTSSFYCVSSSLILSLIKMSLMTSVMMMVLGPGSPLVRAFLHF